MVKNLPVNAGDIRDVGSIPGWGRSPGGGHGNPLQYSCQENSMDRGAWLATVHGVKKNMNWATWLNMTEQLIHFQKLKIFRNYLNLFFWKYLYDGMIGIQRIYNKLYTLIYWASVSIQEVDNQDSEQIH